MFRAMRVIIGIGFGIAMLASLFGLTVNTERKRKSVAPVRGRTKRLMTIDDYVSSEDVDTSHLEFYVESNSDQVLGRLARAFSDIRKHDLKLDVTKITERS